MSDARNDLLAALEEREPGDQMLEWFQIPRHPRLARHQPSVINDAALDLADQGTVNLEPPETGRISPYCFDTIALPYD